MPRPGAAFGAAGARGFPRGAEAGCAGAGRCRLARGAALTVSYCHRSYCYSTAATPLLVPPGPSGRGARVPFPTEPARGRRRPERAEIRHTGPGGAGPGDGREPTLLHVRRLGEHLAGCGNPRRKMLAVSGCCPPPAPFLLIDSKPRNRTKSLWKPERSRGSGRGGCPGPRRERGRRAWGPRGLGPGPRRREVPLHPFPSAPSIFLNR